MSDKLSLISSLWKCCDNIISVTFSSHWTVLLWSPTGVHWLLHPVQSLYSPPTTTRPLIPARLYTARCTTPWHPPLYITYRRRFVFISIISFIIACHFSLLPRAPGLLTDLAEESWTDRTQQISCSSLLLGVLNLPLNTKRGIKAAFFCCGNFDICGVNINTAGRGSGGGGTCDRVTTTIICRFIFLQNRDK